MKKFLGKIVAAISAFILLSASGFGFAQSAPSTQPAEAPPAAAPSTMPTQPAAAAFATSQPAVPTGMTWQGWLLMLASWAAIISLFSYCLSRTLRRSDQSSDTAQDAAKNDTTKT